jgi:hypothetical protein
MFGSPSLAWLRSVRSWNDAGLLPDGRQLPCAKNAGGYHHQNCHTEQSNRKDKSAEGDRHPRPVFIELSCFRDGWHVEILHPGCDTKSRRLRTVSAPSSSGNQLEVLPTHSSRMERTSKSPDLIRTSSDFSAWPEVVILSWYRSMGSYRRRPSRSREAGLGQGRRCWPWQRTSGSVLTADASLCCGEPPVCATFRTHAT